jgi:Ras GTPase-activating protein-binding protein 1
MQLNFRDCRAKIRQVDSHATLGDGVVVQVAGELSNDGKPLRRFMQTFVLAPQSHKKYYVHNDIFRYQDEVFGDSVSVDGIVSPPQQAVTVEPIRQQQPKSNGEGRHDSDKKDVVVPEASKQQQMAGPPPGMNIAPVASVSIQPVPSTEAAGGVLAQAAETLQKQQLQQQQEQQMDKKPSPPQPQQHQDKKVVEENGSAVEQQTRKPMPPQQQQPTQQQQFKPHQPLQKENSGKKHD